MSHYRQQIQATPAFSLIATRSSGGQIYDTFRDFAELVLQTDPQDLDPHVAPMWPALAGVRIDATLTTETMNRHWDTLPIQGNVPLPDHGRRDTDPVSCCVDWPSERFVDNGLWPPWGCYYDRDLMADASRYFDHDLARWFS